MDLPVGAGASNQQCLSDHYEVGCSSARDCLQGDGAVEGDEAPPVGMCEGKQIDIGDLARTMNSCPIHPLFIE